ncbi:MAG: tRNA (adenosine(37)-N6)-threonylcarbamoyltransferase complex dimerization subunit type 1 TsaB [Rhodospirillales bacterium]
MSRGHAEALLPLLLATLADAGRGFSDLDLLAVTVGPGAFTGLRIGLAAARGLALATGLPCLGVTTLEAVAAAVPASEAGGRPLLVALDSKRGDVYAQVFIEGEAASEAAVAAPAGLARLLATVPALPAGLLMVAGDAAAVLPALVAAKSLLPPPRRRGIRWRRTSPQSPRLRSRGGTACRRRYRSTCGRRRPARSRQHRLRIGAAVTGPGDDETQPAPDSGALAALHRLCFDDEPWDAEVFAYFSALPSSLVLTERRDGELVGFVLCRLVAEESEVLTCAVHPDCRRQGIARRLLTMMFEAIRRRGGRCVFLEVANDAPAARALYEQCGFRAVGRRRQYYVRSRASTIDAIVMRRDL